LNGCHTSVWQGELEQLFTKGLLDAFHFVRPFCNGGIALARVALGLQAHAAFADVKLPLSLLMDTPLVTTALEEAGGIEQWLQKPAFCLLKRRNPNRFEELRRLLQSLIQSAKS